MFCNENLVGDVMSGLKGFVVKFMISMSRVTLIILCRCCEGFTVVKMYSGLCHSFSSRRGS